VPVQQLVALFGRGGRLVGAVGFSMAPALMPYRRRLLDGAGFAATVASAAA